MTELSDDDEAPYVCPGCHAVGGESCLPGCIDADIEAEREDQLRRAEYDDPYDELEDPAVDDGSAEELNAIALLESELERSGVAEPGGELLAQIVALEEELAESDDYPGARSCAGCRALVVDDFDHDFCEPDVPTEVMAKGAPEIWREHLFCPGCHQKHPVELERPRNAEFVRISSTSVVCSCRTILTVTYSWVQREVVALRYDRRTAQVPN